MKKVLAIILSIAMLFGVLAMNTFAETTTQPTVTVNSIEVELGKESDLTVTLGNFSAVKGMDLTISTEDDVEFKRVTADKVTLDDTNRTLAAKKIHIVDLVPANTDTIVITIKAVVNKEATIKVTGDLAESGEKLFDAVNETGSITELVLEPKEFENVKTETDITVQAPDRFFIPFGSLYTGTEANASFIDKNVNGKFNITAGTTYSYTQYPIPKSGIMTFGVSDAKVEESDAIQFGTYCDAQETTGRATLVIAGDVSALKTKLGLDDDVLAKKLYEIHNANNEDEFYDNVKMSFTVDGVKKFVRVYTVPQTKYYWINANTAEEATVMEYAVRAYDLVKGEEYAGIGYFTTSSGVTFADTLKFY